MFDPKKPYKPRGIGLTVVSILDNNYLESSTDCINKWVVKYKFGDGRIALVVIYEKTGRDHRYAISQFDLINIEEPEEIEIRKLTGIEFSPMVYGAGLREGALRRVVDKFNEIAGTINLLIDKIDEHTILLKQLGEK